MHKINNNINKIRMRLINKLALAVMSMIGPCLNSCAQKEFRTIGADEFEKAITADSVQLVDVRTQAEFNEAHISSDKVINIDMKQPDFMQRATEELDKNKTVAVYCRSGRRSAEAAGWLAAKGYKVIDLKGGILDWQAKGKSTSR